MSGRIAVREECRVRADGDKFAVRNQKGVAAALCATAATRWALVYCFRSKRSSCITLVHAATKSLTKRSWALS